MHINGTDKPIMLKDLSDDTAKYFMKAPPASIIEFALAKKAILVEGPSEYMLMEKFYEECAGCSPESDGIHIIYSNQSAVAGGGASDIIFVSDHSQIDAILADPNIAKLHYQNSSRYGGGHRNWGDTKGEDHYHDICVMLNKNTASKYATGKLRELPPLTRNKLYVAITRAHGKVYLINE